MGPVDLARYVSFIIWCRCFGGRRRNNIQTLTEDVAIPGVDSNALEHLVYMWQGWEAPSPAELVAEPWRGRYGAAPNGESRRLFKKKFDKDGNVKTFAFVMLQPR